MALMDNIRNMPTSANTLGSDIADWVRQVNSPQYRTWQLQQRSGGAKNPGSVMDFINRFQNMSAGDAFALQWKMNPIGTTTSLIGSGLDVANSIWSSFQNYRTAKQAMDLVNKDYELKKQAYEANEARNQEKFDWLRQSRATSQL